MASESPVATGEPKNEVRVSVVIADFECSPEEISTILGIQPTTTWRRGDVVHPKATNTHHENGWKLSAAVNSESSTIEECAAPLIERIATRQQRLRQLPSEATIELNCVVYVYQAGELPYLGFSASFVRTLAEIGASVDFDIYDLSPEQPKDKDPG